MVRQRSAKPLSPVQIRLPPLRLGANLKRSVRCRCGGIGRRAGFKIPFPHGSIGSTPITGIMDYYTSFKSPSNRAFLLSKNNLKIVLTFLFQFLIILLSEFIIIKLQIHY